MNGSEDDDKCLGTRPGIETLDWWSGNYKSLVSARFWISMSVASSISFDDSGTLKIKKLYNEFPEKSKRNYQVFIWTSVKFKHLDSSILLLTLKYLSCLNSFSSFSSWFAEYAWRGLRSIPGFLNLNLPKMEIVTIC